MQAPLPPWFFDWAGRGRARRDGVGCDGVARSGVARNGVARALGERAAALAGSLVLALALALAVVASPATHAADTLDLAQLMQTLGKVKSGTANFTEQRHVAMLEQTLQSSGRLSFEAPDVFVRETIKPRSERVAINGNTLTLSQGTRTRTMALDSAPEAAVIVEAIRGTLTGNKDVLERHFNTRVSGNSQLWFLELVPREPRLRSQVASVRVAGQQGVVREVLVSLPDGDRSVMSIEPMVAPAASPSTAPPASPAMAPAGATPSTAGPAAAPKPAARTSGGPP